MKTTAPKTAQNTASVAPKADPDAELNRQYIASMDAHRAALAAVAAAPQGAARRRAEAQAQAATVALRAVHSRVMLRDRELQLMGLASTL